MTEIGKSGLCVADENITGSDADYRRFVKFLTVDPANRESAAFKTGTTQDLMRIEDPIRRQIVSAILAAKTPMEYASLAAVDQDVTLRQHTISVMTKLNTGVMDADYYDPGPAQVHPRIGGTFYNGNPPSGPTPVKGIWQNDRFWQTANFADPWEYEFDQRTGTSASAAMIPIFPFRGECAGALQISVFAGAIAALGEAGFDAQHPNGTLDIGPWGPDVRMYLQKVAPTDPMIPGDYFYFKNKDDYSTYAPDGFWQGLNCLYVGADRLFTPRYSGLGASWQCEAELRTTMKYAYMGDCYPHKVDDPETEIRFTVHARLVLAPPPSLASPANGSAAAQPSPRPTPEILRNLAFEESVPGIFVHRSIRLRDLGAGLNFHHATVRQTISAPLFNPSSRVSLGGVPCIVEYHNEMDERTNPEAMVRATVNLGRATVGKTTG